MAIDKTVRVRPATVVGEFRLIRVFGEGSNGSVYEAVRIKTQLPCAVKRLRRPDDPERFEKEALYPARAARQSNHVLNIHSYFQGEDGDFYLVTELIPHGDLGVFLKKNPSLSIQSALEIGMGIARGLAAIHADGIVHLDLKPANVLMDYKDDQSAAEVIADFGLARSSGSVDLNQHGTVGYASPEHFDERLATTPASDMSLVRDDAVRAARQRRKGLPGLDALRVRHVDPQARAASPTQRPAARTARTR